MTAQKKTTWLLCVDGFVRERYDDEQKAREALEHFKSLEDGYTYKCHWYLETSCEDGT